MKTKSCRALTIALSITLLPSRANYHYISTKLCKNPASYNPLQHRNFGLPMYTSRWEYFWWNHVTSFQHQISSETFSRQEAGRLHFRNRREMLSHTGRHGKHALITKGAPKFWIPLRVDGLPSRAKKENLVCSLDGCTIDVFLLPFFLNEIVNNRWTEFVASNHETKLFSKSLRMDFVI